MTTGAEVADVVSAIEPADEQERRHRQDALDWLDATADVFRLASPRTPPKHLVSYSVLRDESDGAVLLVEHLRSGLWLPAGGHVEPGEDPADAAQREAAEELGVDAAFVDPRRAPTFLTVTETRAAPTERHVDVSLWYLLRGSRQDALTLDAREIGTARWWRRDEVAAADPTRFDPHLGRFLAKVDDRGPDHVDPADFT